MLCCPRTNKPLRTRLVGFGGLPLPQTHLGGLGCRVAGAGPPCGAHRLRRTARGRYAKERFARNLGQFVAGKTANNVLLSGARGTGKSSLVKAGLQAHASQGLRLIEVDKADMIDLPDLIELVSGRPERFIIFCDDLSFDEGGPATKP